MPSQTLTGMVVELNGWRKACTQCGARLQLLFAATNDLFNLEDKVVRLAGAHAKDSDYDRGMSQLAERVADATRGYLAHWECAHGVMATDAFRTAYY